MGKQRINNDLQNTTQQIKDGETRTSLKTGGELRCSSNFSLFHWIHCVYQAFDNFSLFHSIHCVYQAVLSISLHSLCILSLSLYFIEFIVYTKPFSLFHWIHCVYQAFLSISLNSLCIPSLSLYFIEFIVYTKAFSLFHWIDCVWQAFLSISLNSLCIPNHWWFYLVRVCKSLYFVWWFVEIELSVDLRLLITPVVSFNYYCRNRYRRQWCRIWAWLLV